MFQYARMIPNSFVALSLHRTKGDLVNFPKRHGSHSSNDSKTPFFGALK